MPPSDEPPFDIAPLLPTQALRRGGVALSNGEILTATQLSVLSKLSQGLTNPEIAHALHLSLSGVTKNVTQLTKRTNLTRVRLAVFFIYLSAGVPSGADADRSGPG